MQKKLKLFRDQPDTYSRNDPRKPLSIKAFTIGYIALCALLLVGVPTPYVGTRMEIFNENYPLTIVALTALYFFLLLLLWILDKIKKKRFP